jgi:hypothetical protein
MSDRLALANAIEDGSQSWRSRRMNHGLDRNGQRRGHYSAVRTSLPPLPSLLEPIHMMEPKPPPRCNTPRKKPVPKRRPARPA